MRTSIFAYRTDSMASSSSSSSALASASPWGVPGRVAFSIEVQLADGSFVDTRANPPNVFKDWFDVQRHVHVQLLGGTVCTLNEDEVFRIRVTPLAGPVICRIQVDGNPTHP